MFQQDPEYYKNLSKEDLVTEIERVGFRMIRTNKTLATINKALGGNASEVISTLESIRNSITDSSTGPLPTELIAIRRLMVDTPGNTLKDDIFLLNDILDGQGQDSTIQTRIETIKSLVGHDSNLHAGVTDTCSAIGGSGSIKDRLGDLGAVSSIMDMIGGSSQSVCEALGNTSSGNSSLATLLGGSVTSLYDRIVGSESLLDIIDGTTTDSGDLTSRLTTQTQSVKSDGIRLSDSIDAVKDVLGGSATSLYDRIVGSESLLDIIDGTTMASGTVSEKLDSQIQSIKSDGIRLSDSIGAVKDVLGGSATSIYDLLVGQDKLMDLLDGTTTASGTVSEKLDYQIQSIKSDETRLSDSIGAVGDVLGGSATSLYDRIVGSDGILDLLDGTTTDSGDLTSKLTTQIQSIKSDETRLSDSIDAVKDVLGGSGTSTYDLIVGQGKLMDLLDGTTTNSGDLTSKLTTQIQSIKSDETRLSDSIDAVGDVLGGSAPSLYDKIVGSDGLLNIIDGTTTNSGDLTSKLTTQVQSISDNSVILGNAISDVNSQLGSSGTVKQRINAVSGALDGVISMVGLTSFTVTIAASTSSGMVSITGNDNSGSPTFSADLSDMGTISSGGTFTLTNASNTITFVNNSGSTISSTDIVTYLNNAYPVGTVLKVSVNAKVIDLKNTIGVSGPNVVSDIANLRSKVLITPASNLSSDLNVARDLITETPGNTLEYDIQGIHTLLNGSTSGSTLEKVINDSTNGTGIIQKIGGSTTSIQDALDDVSDKLFANHNYSSPIYNKLDDLSTTLDNGINSLPDGCTYATVSSIEDDGSNVIVNITAGLPTGGYSISGDSITGGGGIAVSGSFILSYNDNSIILTNRSASIISSRQSMVRYLKSMYPASSKIAIGISDKTVGGIKPMVGGVATSVRGGIANIDRRLLINNTGVLDTDLSTVRNFILTSSPSTTLESDISSINSKLNGSSASEVNPTENIIGSPMVNLTPSNLSAIIGGSEIDLATQLGDPGTGSTGICALIGANDIANFLNTVWSTESLNELGLATNIHDQLSKFLALFQTSGLANGSTSITFDFSNNSGPPTSLADLLSMATVTIPP